VQGVPTVKKRIVVILAVALILMFAGCGAEAEKEDVFNLVESHFDAIVKACEEKDEAALLAIDGITQINMVDGYVIIYCNGAGIAPSSQDYGFYYSAENSPITVNCGLEIAGTAAELTPEGEGLQCVVGGNVFYTEHIKGNIYFYSNAY
jgi:hypothetical protein